MRVTANTADACDGHTMRGVSYKGYVKTPGQHGVRGHYLHALDSNYNTWTKNYTLQTVSVMI